MKKITLSVGIPAHNEEQNIGYLINSIVNQKNDNYELEQIFIICDGCTDKTAKKALEAGKKLKNNIVQVYDDHQRTGKATRLNQIYDLNKSDLLMTMDGDVVFTHTDDISKMVETLNTNKKLLVVGPRYHPMKTHTIMGRFAEYSYLSFEDAVLKLKNGNNIYALMGGCSLMRKELTKFFSYPPYIIADQNYLYLITKKMRRNSFALVKDAGVWFWPVTTFEDWRKLSVRSISEDKNTVHTYFGKKALQQEYYMPRKLYIQSLIKWMFLNPFLTGGAIFMNIYIRMFPYKKDLPKKGIWNVTHSSKVGITI